MRALALPSLADGGGRGMKSREWLFTVPRPAPPDPLGQVLPGRQGTGNRTISGSCSSFLREPALSHVPVGIGV